MEVYNFSPGPSVLPASVLKKAQSELLDFEGTGISILETSHRSDTFAQVIENAESTLREIMDIPDNYKILFLQGGASAQFAMVPMNLFGLRGNADYVNTGSFASKAISEAKKFGDINIVATSEKQNFDSIPEIPKENCDPEADYFHITYNNTIFGTRFPEIPDTGQIPLVADLSSCILSEVIDISRFGLIYAGAQKNIAPAGLTIVIVREDLIGRALPTVPTMFDYTTYASKKSLYNTPPCFSIYFAGMVFEWIKAEGGVSVIEERNIRKAKILYAYLDSSSFYKPTARIRDRSLMNIPFRLSNEALTDTFIREAESNGLVALKGHRLVGGIRASIYNAMPLEGVKKLVEFMEQFEKEYRR